MIFFINTYQRFIENYKKRKERLYKNGLLKYIFNSSGYFLAIVVIITPLMVAIAVDFVTMAATSIGYVYKLNDRAKATALARSGVEVAKQILLLDQRGMSLSGAGNRNVDSYQDDWAMDLSMPLSAMDESLDGLLSINISDENSKINLSVLATDYSDKTLFYGMVQRFFLNMMMPIDYADTIIDWVDPDDISFPFGAETSNYYQTLTPPYSAKNNAMDSIDELLLVKDITPLIYYGMGESKDPEGTTTDNNRGQSSSLMELLASKTVGSEDDVAAEKEEKEFDIKKEKSRNLSNYFTVWGKRSQHTHDYNKINVNTASYRVLSALTDTITDDIVVDIISRRNNTPIKSTNEIKDLITKGSETNEKIFELLSVKSHIFKIETRVELGRAKVEMVVVYNRSNRQVLYWSEE